MDHEPGHVADVGVLAPHPDLADPGEVVDVVLLDVRVRVVRDRTLEHELRRGGAGHRLRPADRGEQEVAQATRGRNCGPVALQPVVPVPGGTVTATATCRVTTMWGSQSITRQAISAVDIYRGTD